jgi:hypothetical protein
MITVRSPPYDLACARAHQISVNVAALTTGCQGRGEGAQYKHRLMLRDTGLRAVARKERRRGRGRGLRSRGHRPSAAAPKRARGVAATFRTYSISVTLHLLLPPASDQLS